MIELNYVPGTSTNANGVMFMQKISCILCSQLCNSPVLLEVFNKVCVKSYIKVFVQSL